MTIVQMALLATIGTWSVTALGAATVVFFRKPDNKIMNVMLGFAAGVMIAASFWSLLHPALEMAEANESPPSWLIVTAGFLCGAAFIRLSDKLVCYAQKKADDSRDVQPNIRLKRIIMLVMSITLHNIPEGLAIGVAFGALSDIYSPDELMGAVSVAIGIGLQNFPEGAAVSVPLRREGYSPAKSFLLGQASGAVEPIAGVIGAVLVVHIEALLPLALSFAAGAMILVAVHELIPECQYNRPADSYRSTNGIVIGFAVMMLLDIMLK